MLESTLTLLKLFVAMAGVVYVVHAWRKAQARHPVFSYEQHSLSNQANWRWRKPDAELALQVEDEEQKSCLRLPAQLLFFEKIFVLFGPVTMVAAIAIIIASFYNLGFAVDGRIIFCALIFYFGTFLLNIGARVSELILYPDHLVVVESYAFVLKHTHIFPHQAGLKFRGKSQSMFEMTYDHEEPDFKLFIERPGFLFFTRRKRFILHANQSQGTWLVAGLHYWHENALSAQAGKP
jgi:hypothetical protein